MRLIDADALAARYMSAPPDYYHTTQIVGEITSAPTLKMQGWISVKDRMPVETHSIFWRLIGSKQWNNAMWREQSDKVLVTVSFKDGTRFVTTGETHDGEWYTTVSRTLTPEVTHWMPLPEPPEEVTGDA